MILLLWSSCTLAQWPDVWVEGIPGSVLGVPGWLGEEHLVLLPKGNSLLAKRLMDKDITAVIREVGSDEIRVVFEDGSEKSLPSPSLPEPTPTGIANIDAHPASRLLTAQAVEQLIATLVTDIRPTPALSLPSTEVDTSSLAVPDSESDTWLSKIESTSSEQYPDPTPTLAAYTSVSPDDHSGRYRLAMRGGHDLEVSFEIEPSSVQVVSFSVETVGASNGGERATTQSTCSNSPEVASSSSSNIPAETPVHASPKKTTSSGRSIARRYSADEKRSIVQEHRRQAMALGNSPCKYNEGNWVKLGRNADEHIESLSDDQIHKTYPDEHVNKLNAEIDPNVIFTSNPPAERYVRKFHTTAHAPPRYTAEQIKVVGEYFRQQDHDASYPFCKPDTSWSEEDKLIYKEVFWLPFVIEKIKKLLSRCADRSPPDPHPFAEGVIFSHPLISYMGFEKAMEYLDRLSANPDQAEDFEHFEGLVGDCFFMHFEKGGELYHWWSIPEYTADQKRKLLGKVRYYRSFDAFDYIMSHRQLKPDKLETPEETKASIETLKAIPDEEIHLRWRDPVIHRGIQVDRGVLAKDDPSVDFLWVFLAHDFSAEEKKQIVLDHAKRSSSDKMGIETLEKEIGALKEQEVHRRYHDEDIHRLKEEAGSQEK